MATHYKNQRITELLEIIASMEIKLNGLNITEPNQDLVVAYTTITIAKAKLTALQGEDK
jgi:ABC-type transport system involved in cytochrome bd biosynthesis fused ATPase/permease subunit